MDSRVLASNRHQAENRPTTMRLSPPGSSGGSPQTMIPPPHPFALAAPSVARTTTLTTPTLPQVGSRSPGYSSNSYSHSTSPSTASGSLPDLQSHDTPSLIISPTQISSATLNAQKRAYRQRRKDPSCDACRERKVKCDATETSACSECSSRNHKCQFTKETNRRMSSIKQVQDLQSQIAELTQMNSQLLTKAPGKEPLDAERTDMKRRHSGAQIGLTFMHSRVSLPPMTNFDHVRKNVRTQAEGLYNTPHQLRHNSHPTGSVPGLPEVPSRADFAHLSRSYVDSIHEWYPAMHWPTFQREVDEVYTLRSFEQSSPAWIGLFFAVLACGSLQTVARENSASSRGSAYFDIACRVLTPWSEDLTIIHAQAALLLSIYAAESNLKSVGSMWLASAARVAQELQISPEVDSIPIVDGEIRRRLWWAIYVRDRQAALDLDKPMLLHESECDISLPSPVEDRYIQPHGTFRSRANTTTSTGFLAIIHITRLYAQLAQTLKSSTIPSETLRVYDEYFRSKMLLLPETYRIGSTALFETAALPTVFALLTARFHLYRRNLTPVCQSVERADALNRCLSVAQDTAKYISRALNSPSKPEHEKSWHTRVAPIGSNMVCLHLWRCTLVLCLRGEYDAALMCLHLSSAIGKTRKVNSACGRNIAFFLEQLQERKRSGRGRIQQLAEDEEMMAYVSGDAQGSLEHSWVWAGTDLDSSASPQISPVSSTIRPYGSDETMHDALPIRTSSTLDKGTIHWDGWGQNEQIVRQLMEEGRPRPAQPVAYYPPPHNPLKRVQLGSDDRMTPKPMPSPSSVSSSASRISIANII